MLHKSKSEKKQLLKFALVIPLLTLLLSVSSCEQTQTDNSEDDSQKTTVEFKSTDERTQINTNNPTPIVTKKRIETSKTDDLGVPFAVIDNAPIYPGCEGLSNEELKQCLSEKINTLISENFDTKVAKNSGLTGRQRITVQFKINQEGKLVDVVARAPYEPFVQEAIRVMDLIPEMTPGKHKGENVSVLYALPIIFEIPE